MSVECVGLRYVGGGERRLTDRHKCTVQCTCVDTSGEDQRRVRPLRATITFVNELFTYT